ncbi:TPA_exp: putative Exopolyphosphatase [Trichophyton benhamiae CBS 112371]|uniref:Exopolyphosphatase, putative n=1 Tax=Arthroderma benhamiae (strain ATCC MYA-4681 / CBS 112371) TaxID=663331 RepID=D4AR22_ARTBC|nr:exopolyphosphatase, putative [Trichophyton benhamiae CBS 112371]EFE34451.1 exopolyphosphatase, putative [Trichophyton benhamiae CBS 112371]DAA77394.1 TPA_exp: putative Exopolyphosphatase [Trichophyton benhamiae CBS 112371]
MTLDKNRQRGLGLLPFLKKAVQHLRASPSAAKIPRTYVLGNTSADLDSIISAIIYSYFASSATSERGLQYIPVINLPKVPAGRELRRLRPEFVTALNLATQRPLKTAQNEASKGLKTLPEDEDTDNILSESILTVASLRDELLNWKPSDDKKAIFINIIMVDWNALPKISPHTYGIPGVSDKVDGIVTSVVGCIDHHDDEGFISKHLVPGPGTRVSHIQTGVGSCTSLVVCELRKLGWWRDVADDNKTISEGHTLGDSDAEFESQAAQLALAAILADTANMTNESKVSDVDREAVRFLENKINQCKSINWDRGRFYDLIMDAKSSSVDYLTAHETLGRDYKEWTDTIEPGRNIKIGICSVIKPVSWILKKCGSEYSEEEYDEEAFFDVLRSFSSTRGLDVVAVMTAFSSSSENEFRRELVVTVLNDEYISNLGEFEDAGADYLRLEKRPFHEKNKDLGQIGRNTRVWRQLDVTKSRKQVAPLLRRVFAGES